MEFFKSIWIINDNNYLSIHRHKINGILTTLIVQCVKNPYPELDTRAIVK